MIYATQERERKRAEAEEEEEEEERERSRESGVRIVRPLVSNWGGGGGSTHYPPYSPLLSSLYNLTLPSLPTDNR